MTATLEQTQSDLRRLVNLVQQGEGVVITSQGQAVARLTVVPRATPSPDRQALTDYGVWDSVSEMKFVKVEFPTEQDAGAALVGLMRRGRVTCLRDGTFILPFPALKWLQENRIPHSVLQQLNQDDVTQALRDLLAHPA